MDSNFIFNKLKSSLNRIGFVQKGKDENEWILSPNLGTGSIRQLTLTKHYLILKGNFTPSVRLIQTYKNTHVYLEIAKLESGNTNYIENDMIKNIENTFLAYYGNNNSGTIYYEANVPVRFTSILITENYYKDYLKQKFPCLDFDPKQAKKIVEGSSSNIKLQLIFNQINNYTDTSIASYLFYESKILDILASITGANCKDVCVGKIHGHDCQMVETAQRIIRDNLLNPPTIAELAYSLCVNTTTLKTKFKQHSNSTIYGYVKTMRMEKSLELLKEKDYSIGKVANTVGYSNHSKFTEAFKKYFGCTPQEIRRSFK